MRWRERGGVAKGGGRSAVGGHLDSGRGGHNEGGGGHTPGSTGGSSILRVEKVGATSSYIFEPFYSARGSLTLSGFLPLVS